MKPYHQSEAVTIYHGDCIEVMAEIEENSVDAVVTDPPYGLEFMGKEWDRLWIEHPQGKQGRIDNRGGMDTWGRTPQYESGIEAQLWHQAWAIQALRVLKPGGYLLAFGGPRTYHRLTCGLEDAGFEIRDTICWLYGSGFPKSLNIGKKLSDWKGWGTALKPAFEPVVVARKPLSEKNVALNVLKHGTGGIDIDGSRIAGEWKRSTPWKQDIKGGSFHAASDKPNEPWEPQESHPQGRWPANVILDEEAGAMLDEQSGEIVGSHSQTRLTGNYNKNIYGTGLVNQPPGTLLKGFSDSGGASRFFKTIEGRNLLFNHAKTIIEIWNKELANTVDDSSSLSKEHVASVLSRAVTEASQGDIQLSNLLGLTMSVTPRLLRHLCESVIIATLNTEGEYLPVSYHIATVRSSDNPARYAEALKLIGTTMIIPSPIVTDGSAVVATLITTKRNTEDGEKDFPVRFRYCAKASTKDRGNGNTHPTCKPVKLMQYLIRLVSREGAIVLDPFLGSGTTIMAGQGRYIIGIEQSEEYCEIAAKRMAQYVMNLGGV